MYAGTMLKPMRNLDRWFGAHQKIDRLARRQLDLILGEKAANFPSIQEILKFEGRDGPDGVKVKTPAKDEPWHFYDPLDVNDHRLPDIIAVHHRNLVKALKEKSSTRASFEAAWLAHAVVDGLTPAHHYPYEEELARLRGGEGHETRTTPKEKLLMPGDTLPHKLKNNWQMWGDKGLLATHIAFEAGVALVILPIQFKKLGLQSTTPADGYLEFFKAQAKKIAEAKLYEQFYESGWTPRLAKNVRKELIPDIVLTVAVVWHSAVLEAQKK